MKQQEEKEKQIIDHFYGEGKYDKDPGDKWSAGFSSKMEGSLEKMDPLEDECLPAAFQLKIDINAIIDEGMRRKEQQAYKEETWSFVISALIIVLSLVLWGNVLGWKTILLWQWILILPVSIIMIPFVTKQNRKEVG